MTDIARDYLTRKQLATKPAKNIRQRGNGRSGQRFNIERLEEACRRIGVDPCEVAAKGLSKEAAPDLSDKERADIALKLMEYLMPKRRAIEGEVEVEHSYVVTSEPMDENDWQDAYSLGATEGAAEGTH